MLGSFGENCSAQGWSDVLTFLLQSAEANEKTGQKLIINATNKVKYRFVWITTSVLYFLSRIQKRISPISSVTGNIF